MLPRMILLDFCLVIILSIFITSSTGSGCPYISVPPGTNRTSDDTATGTSVTYTCTQPDTAFQDDSREWMTTCRPDGSWNRMPHPCRVRRCDAQPVIPYASVSSDFTHSAAVIVYRCVYGYGFMDGASTKALLCNANTLNWDTQPGDNLPNITCDQKFCTQSPHNLNLTTVHWEGLDAYNVNGTVPVGSVITAYCNEGMKKSTNVMMNGKCAASLRLDGVYSECTDISCPSFTTPENAKKLFYSRGYLRRARYKCRTGTFPGGETVHVMQCDNNGQWNSEPALTGCQGGGCEEGWVMYNGNCYWISDATSWGLRYYQSEDRCKMRNAHLITIESREERFFLKEITVDVFLNKDFWIGYHYNTTAKEWMWFDDMNSSYTAWYRGYPELRDSCARMSVNGVWKDRDCEDAMPYICKKPTMCGTPPEITYGGPNTTEIPLTMNVGESLQYVCDEGYSFREDGSTERIVTCLLGSAYSAIENCQRTMCPPLNRPGYWVKNAKVVGSQANSYNNKVTWSCNPGFIFPDRTFSKEIVCQKDRLWSEIPPPCIKVSCPVPAILNADPAYGVAEVGQVDVYTCKTGYQFYTEETERTMVCQVDGTWIPADNCWKRECQPYVQINGNITGGVSGVAKFNDKVQITCNAGYQFPDGSSVKTTKCGPNFHWQPYLPLCEPLTCPPGVAPDVTNAAANSTSATVGTAVHYSCNAGYTFIDGDTKRITVCDTDTQQWIDLPTECMFDLPTQEIPKLGVGLLSTVTAATSLFGIIIITVCLMCDDFAEDRAVLGICVSNGDDDEEEEEEEEGPEPEPVRLQMVA